VHGSISRFVTSLFHDGNTSLEGSCLVWQRQDHPAQREIGFSWWSHNTIHGGKGASDGETLVSHPCVHQTWTSLEHLRTNTIGRVSSDGDFQECELQLYCWSLSGMYTSFKTPKIPAPILETIPQMRNLLRLRSLLILNGAERSSPAIPKTKLQRSSN
jgi:hypothetical protein